MVEKNKEYILNIISEGYEGEGIAKIDGYPIFIEGALCGEKVKVKIVKVKKSYAYGKLLEIIEKAEKLKKEKDIIPKGKGLYIKNRLTFRRISKLSNWNGRKSL